jgi:hypothetical protein
MFASRAAKSLYDLRKSILSPPGLLLVLRTNRARDNTTANVMAIAIAKASATHSKSDSPDMPAAWHLPWHLQLI